MFPVVNSTGGQGCGWHQNCGTAQGLLHQLTAAGDSSILEMVKWRLAEVSQAGTNQDQNSSAYPWLSVLFVDGLYFSEFYAAMERVGNLVCLNPHIHAATLSFLKQSWIVKRILLTNWRVGLQNWVYLVQGRGVDGVRLWGIGRWKKARWVGVVLKCFVHETINNQYCKSCYLY